MDHPSTPRANPRANAPASQPRAVVAGIDVGKAWLDIALLEVDVVLWREPNSPEGHARLIERLKAAGVERVGLEATGGYEAALVAALRAQAHADGRADGADGGLDGRAGPGLAVTVFQPRQVRAYAVFTLRRAKSDRLDAELIARCVRDCDTRRAAPDPRLAALAEPLTRLEQIEEDLARAKIRREHFADAHCLAQLADDIARLTALKKAETRRLGRLVRQSDDLARKMTLLLSIPGIGERTALALLIRMPELGTLSREQAAALVGVAPFVRQSGQYKGQPRTGGGRTRLRTSLFAAAQPAARQWNPELVALHKRLTEAGKPHALAIIACVRKLVIYANTVLAKNTPWIPTTQ